MEIQRGSRDRTPGEGRRNSRPNATRVLGVLLVLAVVALPVLFSHRWDPLAFDPWNNPIITIDPYAAPVGIYDHSYRHLGYVTALLFGPPGPNETRVDRSDAIPATAEPNGTLAVDLTDGNINPGPLLPDLSGYCCFSEAAFAPDGQTISFAGTAPGGWLELIEVSPTNNVTTTRIDPTSNNDYTADLEVTPTGLVTLTSSTNTNETLVLGNTFTAPTVWIRLTSRTSNTVYDNDHPALAVNPVSEEGFLFYTEGTDANLLKFDVVTGNTIWEFFDIVDVGSGPAGVFRYFQAVEDDGNVALFAPRTTDTMIVFIEDTGGPALPTDVQYHTVSGVPPGDHQILQLDNRTVTAVYPDQDGTGTEVRHVVFNPDPTVPPNVWTYEDNTVTGAWHNTAPGYAVFLTDTANPRSAVVYDLKPNRLFVVQGDPDTDVVRYGTYEVPIMYDSFESNSTKFWSNSNP